MPVSGRRGLQHYRALLWVCLLILISGCHDFSQVPVASPTREAAMFQADPEETYRIGPGDGLVINSYLEPSLKQPLIVQPDGKISLLLVGDITAAGKTTGELRRELSAAYTQLIPRADIAVTVTEVANQAVYVGGEVRQPSMQPARGKVTLLSAIIAAGGFTPGANRGQVLILRADSSGRVRAVQHNVDAMLSNQAEEIYLRRHDVVYVPKTQIAQANQFVDQYINQMIPRQIQMLFGYQYVRQLGIGGGGGGTTAVLVP
jgi:protein involved in polysaccharide export with SLBB domain